MSAWIQHVKDYASQHNCSYKDALKGASSSYRSMKGHGMRADFVEREKNRSHADELKALKHAGKMLAISGYGVGRRKKYTKWVDALGAKDLIDAGMSKGASTISGSGVGRRNKYTKWVAALGAKDLIDAGMSKGASTISGSGAMKLMVEPTMTKKQAIASLQMANAMYGDQAMSQLKKHRKKLSGMALYAAGY
jgi:hypothetical protein